ncbi:uncharacterized protein VTP21DRAFT_2861 [Calcarisporiella thermophila]|uniref:uncharacterized protein n=1 Tax=Calcarisporiella thermophila TaxID=911321 RepID=UPI003742C4FA
MGGMLHKVDLQLKRTNSLLPITAKMLRRHGMRPASPSPSPALGEQTPLLQASECERFQVGHESWLDRMARLAKLDSEARVLVEWCLPLILGYSVQIVLRLVDVYFLRSLGPSGSVPLLRKGVYIKLYAASIGSIYMMFTAFAIGWGLSTSLDTYCVQSLTIPSLLPLLLQRTLVLVTLLIFLPATILFFFSGRILLRLGLGGPIAKLVGDYVWTVWFGLWANFAYVCLRKYMQVRGHMRGVALVLIAAIPVSVLSNFIWVRWARLGLVGSGIALASTYWALAVGSAAYVFTHGLWERGGPALAGEGLGWKGLWPFLKLGMAGIVAETMEWHLELAMLIAGGLGRGNLAAQSMLVSGIALLFPLSFSIGTAATVRVGNYLGLAQPEKAQQVAHWAVAGAGLMAAGGGVFLVLLGKLGLARWIGADKVVNEYVGQVVPLVAVVHMGLTLAVVCRSVLYACGRQSFVAQTNLMTYYGLIPIVLHLAFKLGLSGLWIGLAISSVANAGILLVRVLCLDWAEEVEAARDRLKQLRPRGLPTRADE